MHPLETYTYLAGKLVFVIYLCDMLHQPHQGHISNIHVQPHYGVIIVFKLLGHKEIA